MDSALSISGLDPVLSFFLELGIAATALPVLPYLIYAATYLTGCGFTLFLLVAVMVDAVYRLIFVDVVAGILEGFLAYVGVFLTAFICDDAPPGMEILMKDLEMMVKEGPGRLVKRLVAS